MDIGCQGRISDELLFEIVLFKKPSEKSLNLASRVYDIAFGLSKNVMNPGIDTKASKERHFNYRLLRDRRIVENVFGILASVFRVLRKLMLLEPTKVAKVVMACALLHNFLRKSTSANNYAPLRTFHNEHQGQIIPGR